MLLATIDISWKAQDIVNVFIEVVSLILEQNPNFFIVFAIVIVIGAFLLISFGVCCGLCCFECFKRCFAYRAGPCYDEGDIEKGRPSKNILFQQKMYKVNTDDVKKQYRTFRSSEPLDGKNIGTEPV